MQGKPLANYVSPFYYVQFWTIQNKFFLIFFIKLTMGRGLTDASTNISKLRSTGFRHHQIYSPWIFDFVQSSCPEEQSVLSAVTIFFCSKYYFLFKLTEIFFKLILRLELRTPTDNVILFGIIIWEMKNLLFRIHKILGLVLTQSNN